MRQSEAGALAAGMGAVRYRLWALAVVTATTGVAGGLLAGNSGLLDPISQGVPPLLNSIGVNGNLIFVLLGFGVIQAITTAPQGIAGQLQGLARRIRRAVTKGRKP